MNKWFLSLVLLSFGASVFAQTPAQVNPFSYYKSDNIFKTDIDVKPKKLPNLTFNVKSANLNGDLSRSEEHKLSGQYNTKVFGGAAGLKFSNNKDFLTQNINQSVDFSYGLSGPFSKLSLTVNAFNTQPLIGSNKNNTLAELKGTISF
jgi:hypothetical protein